MKLVCHLRGIRGKRSLAEISRASGVSQGDLSRIERGLFVPRDEWIEPLERVYGQPITDWYPPTVLLALAGDDA